MILKALVFVVRAAIILAIVVGAWKWSEDVISDPCSPIRKSHILQMLFFIWIATIAIVGVVYNLHWNNLARLLEVAVVTSLGATVAIWLCDSPSFRSFYNDAAQRFSLAILGSVTGYGLLLISTEFFFDRPLKESSAFHE